MTDTQPTSRIFAPRTGPPVPCASCGREIRWGDPFVLPEGDGAQALGEIPWCGPCYRRLFEEQLHETLLCVQAVTDTVNQILLELRDWHGDALRPRRAPRLSAVPSQRPRRVRSVPDEQEAP